MSSHDTHPMILALEQSDESAFVLSPDMCLLHISKGWTTFAENNGGEATLRRWPMGASIDDALPPPLREFYREAYATALRTGERWEHDYECSSPTVYRKFRMSVYPIDRLRLCVVSSLVVDVPHPAVPHAPDEIYAVDGFVTMCAHCRRTSNPRTLLWDWVPAYVASMPSNASHGMCPTCMEFYFPETEVREAS
jgi:hypothetical protein